MNPYPHPFEMNDPFFDAWFEFVWVVTPYLTDDDNGEAYIMGGEL